MAYGYLTEPGAMIRTHRDYNRYVAGVKTQIISLELAVRGFFPVHRGELSLSLPMTDEDISSFIGALKEVVEELESE